MSTQVADGALETNNLDLWNTGKKRKMQESFHARSCRPSTLAHLVPCSRACNNHMFGLILSCAHGLAGGSVAIVFTACTLGS